MMALSAFAVADLPDQNLTFAQCYRQHRDTVFRWCLRYGSGSVAWAEDATQDVFLALHRALPRLKTTEDLGAWLYRVTAHLAFKRLRREGSLLEKVLLVLRADAPEPAPSSEALLGLAQETQQLLAAVGTLPPNQRMVVWMTLVDGKRGVEVADALGLSKGQVSKLLARGTAQLKVLGWGSDDGG